MKRKYSQAEAHIINTARKLFLKKGFEETTTRDIAKEANINASMINYYFRSKHKLFYIAFEEVFEALPKKVLPLMDSGLPLFEIIRKWVHLNYEIHLTHPDVFLYIFSELIKNLQRSSEEDETLQYFFTSKEYEDKTLHTIYSKLSKLLKKEAAKGTIKPISIPDFLFTCFSLLTFPFAGSPLAKQFLNLSDKEYVKFLHKYQDFVADVIINMLKK